MVSNPVPDARRAGPGIAWKERRTAPRHAAVWVRIGGTWRRGRIIEWVRQLDRDGWDCVIMADEPVSGPPWQGRYAFDPQSIRPRDTDQPPGLSHSYAPVGRRRTAHKYSNATGTGGLRQAATGQRPALLTANDLAAESLHREA
jgi:hypothetical protein